jgi:cardiolipin synthase (CMP-forming)
VELPAGRLTARYAERVSELPEPSTEQDERPLLRQALNVPNLISLLRLAGVPVFLWLLLGPKEDGWALALLIFSAFTDWLDGKVARWLNQMSALGRLLDPAADRLYILATLIAFLLRDIIPWWVVAPLVLREAVVGVAILILRRNGFAPPEVTYIGKGATFVLMYAFPFLLLTTGHSGFADFVRPIAYAFTTWGGVLYLWSGALYLLQTARALRGGRADRDAVARA